MCDAIEVLLHHSGEVIVFFQIHVIQIGVAAAMDNLVQHLVPPLLPTFLLQLLYGFMSTITRKVRKYKLSLFSCDNSDWKRENHRKMT